MGTAATVQLKRQLLYLPFPLQAFVHSIQIQETTHIRGKYNRPVKWRERDTAFYDRQRQLPQTPV